ncbi:MAG: acyltransferase [Treponema sp.]|nr:acyltransferase [Treponema sp.]
MNYFTIVFYLLILAMTFIGAKFVPLKELNKNAMSFDNSTAVKGLMAFLVLCHHISQKKAFHNAGEIQFFEQIGFLFVGIFFFCSGYGLYKSFKTKPDYFKGFFKKRMLPLICAWYVMVAFYVVYNLVTGVQKPAGHWVTDVLGLTLINSQSWYVISILLLYGATAIAFKHCKTEKGAVGVVLANAIVHGLIFIFIGHFIWFLGPKGWWRTPYALWNPDLDWWLKPCTWWFHGEWWVNSTLCFPFGMWFCMNEEKIQEKLKKFFALKAVIFVVLYAAISYGSLITFWEFNYWKALGSDAWANNAICYAAQSIWALSTCVLVYFVLLKVNLGNPVLTFMGKRSLEIYLMQEMVLFSFHPLIQNGMHDENGIIKPYHWNLILYAVCVIACVMILAVIYNLINRAISKALKK